MSNDELFDKVTEDDEVIGQITRGQAHTEGHIHRSVLFYLFDRQGRIYVNQRTEDKDFYPLHWSIVFGGHVSAGQDYDQAVVREAKEEAGVKNVAPFYLASFKKRFDYFDKENVRVYGFILDGEPQIDPAEIKQGSFLTLEEMKQKMTELSFLPETQDMYRILKDNHSKLKDRL